MNLNQVLIRPMITEQAMEQTGNQVYSFVVVKKASKPLIKKAIEEQFGVEVGWVRTMIYKGKVRRAGKRRIPTQTSDFKKAVVKLKGEKKIELFGEIT